MTQEELKQARADKAKEINDAGDAKNIPLVNKLMGEWRALNAQIEE